MAKKRTTAQKQRARLRQQQRAAEALPKSRAGRPGAAPSRRSTRRSSARWSWIAVGVVVAVVAGMIVLSLNRSTPQSTDRGSAAAIAKVTNVPESALAKVGIPKNLPTIPHLPAGTPPVLQDGKPVVTYVGAEYCPFCAMERWPVVIALSRFGTFSNLRTTTSAANDIHPNTPTLTFHGATYTSDYLVFSAVETHTNRPTSNGGYTALDPMTPEQQRLFETYDRQQYTGGTDGGIPFVMIGNLYAWAGATYNGDTLNTYTFDQIANLLADPSNPVGREILGAANQITALICDLTGGRPASVCSAPYLQQAQKGP